MTLRYWLVDPTDTDWQAGDTVSIDGEEYVVAALTFEESTAGECSATLDLAQ